MRIHAPAGSLSFIEFFSVINSTQYQLILPVIALVYLISTIFYDEIAHKIMFLYKDLDRKKILNAKLQGILGIELIYFALTFLLSIITYYTYLIKMPYASGDFFPKRLSILQSTFL